jgi:heptosyltransferase-2
MTESGIRRLIVRMPNWLGDAVLALPAVAAVRRAHPSAELAVAAIPSIAPLFEEQTPARQQRVLVVEKSTEARVLREAAADAILLLPNSFRTAWTARRSGIGERWGYRTSGRGMLLTRGISRPRKGIHQSAYYSELVRALGVPVPDENAEPPVIAPTAATAQRAAKLLDEHVAAGQKIVGFAPGAAYGHAKRWPPERVAQVVIRLAREHQAVCVLVGAAADREAGRAIESSLPPDARVLNLIGRTDLRVLVGVLARCAAFVSNDSGAMHLAAAVGVPVTAIFGPTNERATAPLGRDGQNAVLLEPVFCRPCMLRECPIDHRCMKRISADAVFASVSKHL